MGYFIPLSVNKYTSLPDQFTNPFDYTPNLLCIEAQKHLQKHLPRPESMPKGKMFGILVVTDALGKLGYLASFSGNETNKETEITFVPQIFDITNPQGYFKQNEAKLTELNKTIAALEKSEELANMEQQLTILKKEADVKIGIAKNALKKSKNNRSIKRQGTDCEEQLQELIKESQFEKSQFNQLKKKLKESIDALEKNIVERKQAIASLKQERKRKSNKLQKQLFDSYVFNNILGESKNATDIFHQLNKQLPPAGTGDCAAPKLLNHAFANGYKPVCMAEFWWGPSPKAEIRKHGYFYAACKSKCEPILAFMLKGLNVESSPNTQAPLVEILYNDDQLVVINKPHGLLSVPGKENHESVYSQVKALYPQADGPLIVHRLDLATSGLMVLAKNKTIHKALQLQFLNRTVKKTYVALLDGNINESNGEINLPLRVDINDRPRQLVCFKHGKPATTKWQLIEQANGQSRIYFYPITGRTHQLRVHAAHIMGLNTPITGDPLYGIRGKRLMLHAEKIEFDHPTLKQRMSFKKEADF